MKKLNTRMAAAAATILSFLLTGFARGSDLVWTGSAGGLWGSGLNWTNSAGEATAFATGDNVRFDDGAAVRSVNLSANVTAGVILFDTAGDYTLTTSVAGTKIVEASALVKRGGGTVTVNSTGHTYTNDIRIEAGSMVANVPNAGSTSPLGSGTVERRIYVSTNATLRLAERNSFGGAETTALKAEIHVDQGLLEFGKPGGVKGVNTLGNLTLHNASMAYTNMGEGTYGFLKVCRTFSLSGTQPYDFSNFSRSDLFMLLNSNPHTEFRVADITGNADADVTLRFPFKHVSSLPVSGLIKTGPGSMVLANASSTFQGNIQVREGELVAAAAKLDTNNTQTVLGNARVSRSIYVGTNATLTFAERNTLGIAEGDTPAVAVTVDHGTLAITNSGHTTFGALTLDSATFSYKDGYDATRGILRLGGKLTLKGDAPYVFDSPAGAAYGYINLSASPLTEINVADITGDPAPDASFRLPLKDFASSNSPTYAAGFIKTGAGTLYLTNATSTFSGDIEVREGVLVADTAGWGSLGNANPDRRILVSTNGVLQLRQRNTMGGAAATNSLRAEIVVDHGVLLLGDVNVPKGVNTVGSLTLLDGALNYTNMYNDPYGFLKVARVFRLKGTAPYVFDGSAQSGCHMLMNAYPLTTFEVDDITADAEPDATFHFPFKNHPSSTAACGLVKTGEGTMRVTAASTYIGATLVSNGVLRVDGSLAASSGVTVLDGGWLGGTGTVSHVAVEAGGGFQAIQGQAKPLTVTGTLTLEGGGAVYIRNPGGVPGMQIQVVLATVSGTVSGLENADAWTVEIEGAEPSVNYRLRVVDSELVAGYAPKGTMISVR